MSYTPVARKSAQLAALCPAGGEGFTGAGLVALAIGIGCIEKSEAQTCADLCSSLVVQYGFVTKINVIVLQACCLESKYCICRRRWSWSLLPEEGGPGP